MTYIYRPEWSGTTGGPGVSVLTARRSTAWDAPTFAQEFANNVRAFFDDVASRIPNEVTITFPGEVLELDTVTGQLVASIPVGTPPAAVPGRQSGTYSMAVGGAVEWRTEAIVNGRRLRGRTYIVPLGSTSWTIGGVLDPVGIAQIETAARNLVDNMDPWGSLAVWSRTHGILADVSAVNVPPRGAVLRSRRD